MKLKDKPLKNFEELRKDVENGIGKKFSRLEDLIEKRRVTSQITNMEKKLMIFVAQVNSKERSIGQLFGIVRQKEVAARSVILNYDLASVHNEENFSLAHVAAQSHVKVALELFTNNDVDERVMRLATRSGLTVRKVALDTLEDYGFELRRSS